MIFIELYVTLYQLSLVNEWINAHYFHFLRVEGWCANRWFQGWALSFGSPAHGFESQPSCPQSVTGILVACQTIARWLKLILSPLLGCARCPSLVCHVKPPNLPLRRASALNSGTLDCIHCYGKLSLSVDHCTVCHLPIRQAKKHTQNTPIFRMAASRNLFLESYFEL